jgi:undecaprenyl-diphosphatase
MTGLTIAHAAMLGALQGLTEFLPVSSSGHLMLGRRLLGLPEADPALDAALHLGTLPVLLWYFRREILALPRHPALLRALVVATVVTAALGFPLQRRAPHTLPWAGVGWLVGAALLFATRLARPRREDPGAADAVRVGVAQTLSVAPGISRLGSTLSVSLLVGVEQRAAVRFAYLLAIPPVAGQAMLGLRGLGAGAELGPLVAGALVAAAVGLAVVGPAVRWIEAGRVHRFAYYLAPLGATVILWNIFSR